MDIDQFAVYQLRKGPKTRALCFRSYEELSKSGQKVCHENYEQVYIGRMRREDTPQSLKKQLEERKPKGFGGHSVSVSDVLALNHEGKTTAYYVEKDGFRELEGFLPSSFAKSRPLSFGTTGFQIEGKAGSWLVLDTILFEGREFFLMEHETYGTKAAYVVLDEAGKVVVEDNQNGFDGPTRERIKEYLHPGRGTQGEPAEAPKETLQNWQKYLEDGEYLRSAGPSDEDGYGPIDGCKDDAPPKKKRRRESVLARLRKKQAEIAMRRSRQALVTAAEGMEQRQDP